MWDQGFDHLICCLQLSPLVRLLIFSVLVSIAVSLRAFCWEIRTRSLDPGGFT